MSVQYNVSTLLKEPVGSTREYDVDDSVLVNEDGPQVRTVVGRVRFLRTNEGILVSARLEGTEQESCSRCLQPLEIPVKLIFEEMFYPATNIGTGVRASKPEDPDALRISERWILDLEEPIRQFWTVTLPMQPLCRDDCRGLCPQCGQDWNEGACDCPPPGDERWSALTALLRK